jgi:AmiR/NasT family two-component response regulator
VAGTVAGARAAIQQSVPDLVLLDLRLPDGDAEEALADVVHQTHVRIVAFTCVEEPARLRGLYDLGVHSVVRKPLARAEFLETATTITRYWLKANQPHEK